VLRRKLLAFLAVMLFVFCFVGVIKAQNDTSVWRDDLNYSSFNQFQAAGWSSLQPTGISFSGTGVILDGTQGDNTISYSNRFPSGIYDWKVEARSKWTLGSHSGINIGAVTEKHTYHFMADGWYSGFAFYRDSQLILRIGIYQEISNEWITLRMEKHGNQIDMYYNDQHQNSYTETDTTPSQLIGYTTNSPWQGGAEFEYFQVWSSAFSSSFSPSVSPSPSSSPISSSGDVTKTAWVPAPANGAVASIFAISAVSISSLIFAAASSAPAGAASSFFGKLIDKIRELMPATIKKWLEDFIASKRKLKIDEKTGSPYLPTKSEAIVYGLSILFSTFAFSYVKVNNLDQILIIIPTFFATSILVSFARTYLLAVYTRKKGVWTEYKLWPFGLGLFLLSTLAFRTPFSSPTRTVRHSKNFTARLAGFLSCAAIFITLGFAAFFFILYKSGFALIGGTGLAMCLISAFFDTFPIEPMSGRSVYKYNKALWGILFVITLTLYVLWIAQII
jgi:hypothetical protein